MESVKDGGRIEADQELVVAGTIGWQGTKAIVSEKRTELTLWFSKSYLKEIENKKEILIAEDPDLFKQIGISGWEYVEEGGIFTALWNLSGRNEIGIEFHLRQIPIDQSTIEICERYQLNPYRLYSGNCFVFIADHGYSVVDFFQKKGISSAVIGKVNRGIKREIYHDGERGFLERPKKDELKKVYPSFFIKKNTP